VLTPPLVTPPLVCRDAIKDYAITDGLLVCLYAITHGLLVIDGHEARSCQDEPRSCEHEPRSCAGLALQCVVAALGLGSGKGGRKGRGHVI